MTDKISYSYRVNDAKPSFVQDGLTSLISGLGGSLDPSRSSFYTPPLLTRDQIDNSYRTSWLSQTIHDAVPIDTVRNWRTWQAPDDVIPKIEKEERRLGLKNRVLKAETLSRLYGGAILMMGVRNDNPSEPLDVTTVREGDLKYIHAIDRHSINVPGIILDPGSPQYGEPITYQINTGNGSYVSVDPSRVCRFLPKEMPEHIALANGGWSDPILYSINQSIKDADQAQGSFSALTTKARTDTVTIPNLIELASTADGEAKLKQRIQIMKAFESIFSTRILAGGRTAQDPSEAWNQFQVNFANMPEMMAMFWQAVAGASGVPLTRLIGTQPNGLNATGEADQQAYYELLSARQEMSLRPRLEMIDEVLIRSATGQRDPDIWFQFAPLAVDSSTVKATNSQTRANAIKLLADSQAVPSDVLMKLARGQIVESGDYPGADEAYDEYEAAGGDYEPVEAPDASNDNGVLSSTIEGLAAQGKSASVAARDAIALCDSVPRPLYVARMVLNRDELQAWATEQGLGELQPNLHVTIAYSTAPVDWMTMENSWADRNNDGSGQLLVTAGGPRLVEPLGDQTAVLMFSSTDLQWRNEEMRRKGCSWDFQDYTPHISLTKNAVDLDNVQPYRGSILLGPEIFQTLDDDLDEDD